MNTTEEQFEQIVWWALQEIKKQIKSTANDNDIHFAYQQPGTGKDIPSIEDQKRALKNLWGKGAIGIVKEEYQKVQGIPADHLNRFEGTNYPPIGASLVIVHPRFDTIHQRYLDKAAYATITKRPDVKETENRAKLSSQKIKFNDRKATIEIGDNIVQMPPNKNEHYFCRAVFAYKANRPIDWSIIYEKITGFYREFFGKPANIRNNWRTVYDAMEAINKRIKDKISPTGDDLFSWQEKTIRRNF